MGDQLNLPKLCLIISSSFFFSNGKMKMRPHFGSSGKAAMRKGDWFADMHVICQRAVGNIGVDISSPAFDFPASDH